LAEFIIEVYTETPIDAFGINLTSEYFIQSTATSMNHELHALHPETITDRSGLYAQYQDVMPFWNVYQIVSLALKLGCKLLERCTVTFIAPHTDYNTPEDFYE
jgi:hypothetical protein